MPPSLPRICVYLCKYMYECAEKTFPNYKFGKGQYAFYPVKLYRFAEKKQVFLQIPSKYCNNILQFTTVLLYLKQTCLTNKIFKDTSPMLEMRS